MKTAVIGYSGSGKSTLAKYLARLDGCPVLYLDTVKFTEGWQERDREETLKLVREFMKNGSWVIDGNYSKLMQEERLLQADRIVFMISRGRPVFGGHTADSGKTGTKRGKAWRKAVRKSLICSLSAGF